MKPEFSLKPEFSSKTLLAIGMALALGLFVGVMAAFLAAQPRDPEYLSTPATSMVASVSALAIVFVLLRGDRPIRTVLRRGFALGAVEGIAMAFAAAIYAHRLVSFLLGAGVSGQDAVDLVNQERDVVVMYGIRCLGCTAVCVALYLLTNVRRSASAASSEEAV